jgi:hypothetical protein
VEKILQILKQTWTRMHRTKPLLSEYNSFKFEIDIEELKRYILPGINQILTELFQAVEGIC